MPDLGGSKLMGAVGPNQTNRREDVLVVQQLLNQAIASGALVPLRPIAETGLYNDSTSSAIREVESRYFYGMADPLHRIQPDDETFHFLVALGSERISARQLSGEMYGLAAKMVPGGADKLFRNKRTTGTIRTYLPDILVALTNKNLGDADMVLMALATIRAETSGFVPMDEGVSKYNTSPKGTPNRHPFDLYDDRKKSLGNLGAPDGALFKGRGFVQLTGRDNYASISKQLGLGDSLVKNPDRANDPKIAAQILAQFLANKEHQIRGALKTQNLALARQLVNGGSHGLAEFTMAFNDGRQILHLAMIQRAKKKAAVKANSKTTTKLVAGVLK